MDEDRILMYVDATNILNMLPGGGGADFEWPHPAEASGRADEPEQRDTKVMVRKPATKKESASTVPRKVNSDQTFLDLPTWITTVNQTPPASVAGCGCLELHEDLESAHPRAHLISHSHKYSRPRLPGLLT